MIYQPHSNSSALMLVETNHFIKCEYYIPLVHVRAFTFVSFIMSPGKMIFVARKGS